MSKLNIISSLFKSMEESGAALSLSLNDVSVSVKDGKVHIHVSAEASADKSVVDSVLNKSSNT